MKAGRMARDMAYERGKGEICTIWDTRYHGATNLRRKAFEERCKELGLQLDTSTFSCEGSTEAGYELGVNLIKEDKLRRIIYCNRESVAKGVVAALNEFDTPLGRDYYLFSANKAPSASLRYTTPSITGINLQLQLVFENGLRKLLNMISRVESTEKGIIIQPKVVYRNSLPEII